jgi:hypothetical protein
MGDVFDPRFSRQRRRSQWRRRAHRHHLDEDYRAIYREAGLEVERFERPLGTDDDRIPWISETKVAPWAIYILKPAV